MSQLISVVIPVFNRKAFIVQTIESVINQTYPHWELLLVDDGSTDNSFEIATQFAVGDSRIKAIKRTRLPKGAPTCRNIGLEQAKGNYVIFLDSDDLMAPYCLEQRLARINEYPIEDFWVFPMLIFKEEIDDTRRLTNYSTQELDLYRFLRSDVVWQTTQPIWRKSSLMTLGAFDDSFPNCQDHDLHLRALLADLKYKKFLDDKPDTFYRNHDGEKIYQPKDPLRVLKGVNMLMLKLARAQPELIIKDVRSKNNLFVFLFAATRSYTRNNEFNIPKDLVKCLMEFDTIRKRDYNLVRIYIELSKLGLNRVRGYERLWDLITSRKKHPMTWGSRTYTGEL